MGNHHGKHKSKKGKKSESISGRPSIDRSTPRTSIDYRNSISTPPSIDLSSKEEKEKRHLDLSHLKISKLDMKVIEPLCPHLISLDLSNNMLLSFPKEPLEQMVLLEKLDLSHNVIKKIDWEDSYLSMDAIQRVIPRDRIPENATTEDGRPLFSLRLKELDLSSNHLTKFTPATFEAFQELTSLDLSNNHFDEFPDSIFVLSKLKVLKIASNSRLQKPPTYIPNLLVNLVELDMSDSRFKSFPVEFTFLSSLEILNAARNRMQSIPSEVGKLVSLKKLDLSDNELEELPEEMKDLTLLKSLQLQGNMFKSFSPNLFDNMSNMAKLNFSRNEITEFPNAITKMNKLKILTISENKIQSLPQELNKIIPNLKIFEFDRNDLVSLPDGMENSLKINPVVWSTSLPIEILSNMYIGDYYCSIHVRALKFKGISHIMRLSSEGDPPFPNDFKYLDVRIRDEPDEDLMAILKDCIDFINEGRGRGGILLQSRSGGSRCAAISIGYLIQELNYSYEEASDYLIRHKKDYIPNSGFQKQLAKFASETHNTPLPEKVPSRRSSMERTRKSGEIGRKSMDGGRKSMDGGRRSMDGRRSLQVPRPKESSEGRRSMDVRPRQARKI